MSHSTRTSVSRGSHRLRTPLALLLAAIAGIVTASFGPGSASAAPTPKTIITIDTAYTQPTPPAANGRGPSYVVAGQPFTVTFHVSAPLSTTKTTRLLLTSSSAAGTISIPFDLEATKTWGIIPDAVLDHALNNVQLKLDVAPSKNTVQPGTLNVDVLKTSLRIPASGAGTSSLLVGFGGGGGVGVPCSPTPSDQVCGDLIVPSTRTVTSDLLVSQGCITCDIGDASSFLQALFVAPTPGATPEEQLAYARQNPLTLIVKCDKSLCAGKGIKSYNFDVLLTPTSEWTTSQACATKGVVDADKLFCTDYVQSTRDNAGDLLLYVLFADDLKGIIR